MWMGMINQTVVLRLLKGRCYSNQLIWGLFANVEIDRLQSHSGVLKGNVYRHLHKGINTSSDAAIVIKKIWLTLVQ